MGCDIHLYVERRVNGKWEPADTWVPDPYRVEDLKVEIKDWEEELKAPDLDETTRLQYQRRLQAAREELESVPKHVPYDNAFYSGRNYNLFSILADVRNGYGFGGCDTGDGFVPICEPKGLPFDVTPTVRAQSDSWGGDGHSHSWFTVEQLDAYDWTQATIHRYWTDSSAYYQWYLDGYKGGPSSCCGGVSGPRIEHVSEQEMKKRINEVLDKFPEGTTQEELSNAVRAELAHVYCQVEWRETYAECCRYFIETTLPALRELGNPEDVRIVFWFDN